MMLALIFASKRLKYLKKERQITKDLWKREKKKGRQKKKITPIKDNFRWFELRRDSSPQTHISCFSFTSRHLCYEFFFLLFFCFCSFSFLFLNFFDLFFFSILIFPELESPPSLYGRCTSDAQTAGHDATLVLSPPWGFLRPPSLSLSLVSASLKQRQTPSLAAVESTPPGRQSLFLRARCLRPKCCR